ncbi:MAG: tetratricopeptide repeat protein [Deltaproteobacteria bacterium]|nr:tetratricopeptide repeat protein [Deltaproteobacteria bacterium]
MKISFFWILIFAVPIGLHGESMRNRVKIKKSSELIQEDNGSDEYTLEKLTVLAKKRKSLIQDIKRFLREAKSEDQKRELNLRLGTLFMEDYHALLAQAQVKMDDKNPEIRGSAKADQSEAHSSLDKALTIYQTMLNRYPKHPRSDEMLYALAIATQDKGRMAQSMHYFQRISVEAPRSKYIDDARVQLGDYYFDRNNYNKAMEYFDQIVHAKNRRLLPYAIYKKAWCLYNQQKYEQSIKHFKWVAKSDTKESNVRVRAEAIRDIALPFVELKTVDDAVNFYREQGDQFYRQGLESLSGHFQEKGRYAESISLYSKLLEIDANYKSNPTYEIAIVDALRLSNHHKEAIYRLFSRFPLYGNSSNWYELNSQDPATINELMSRFEATARKYAMEYHAEGQRTKNESLYNAAKTLYAKYLESFPLSSQAAQIRFYLAEILFKQNQFTEAADHYYLIYKDKAAGALRLDGLKYSLAALDRVVNDDRKKQGLAAIDTSTTARLKDNDTSSEPVPFSQTESKFLSVADEYLAQYPNQKDAPDVMYEVAYLRYTHRELSAAQKGFWSLIQRYPKHTVAVSSAYLVLDIMNRKADYSQLIQTCKNFLGHKEMTKSSFRIEVASVLRQAELKRVSLFEEKGQHKSAADGYIEYTKAYGAQDDLLFEKALYNASVNYTKAEAYLAAVDTQERFLRRFPKSGLRQNMLLSVARTHEMMANFDKSALFYEEFANEYAGNAQARNALRLAGIYYWGSNHHRQAENVLLDYRKRFPADSKIIAKDILDLYESQGLVPKEIQFFLEERARRGISASEYMSLSYKIFDLQMKAKGKVSPELTKEIARTAQHYRKDLLQTPKGAEAYARFVFSQTNIVDAQFSRMHLSGKNMEKVLKTKLALLKNLENEYTGIAKLGSPEWGLASMYRTALAYQQMALEISQAPVPGELSSEQIDIYRKELNQEMILPFTEKARTLTKTCLEKATELNLLSSWVPRCYSLAAELAPDSYRSVRSFYLPPLQVALSIPPSGSRVAAGDFKRFSYPFYSSFLFQPSAIERSVTALPDLGYSGLETRSEARINIPSVMDYRSLNEERKKLLTKLAESNRPLDNTDLPTFAYLNLVRATNPGKAVPLIQRAIQSDPKNTALHNLLGVAYLDEGHLSSAKVVFLSLLARGEKNAAIATNLGVIAYLENHEGLAKEYWLEATSMDGSREASLNLGSVALKYHNGFEAKSHMERALSQGDQDAAANVGAAVALLQNGSLEDARERLTDLSKKFKSDPYARLSIGYFLMDIDKKPDVAEMVLSEYMESHDNVTEIRQALSETKRSLGSSTSGAGLPTIGQ